jgi:hypothetical protein
LGEYKIIVVSIALSHHRLQNVKNIVKDFMTGSKIPDKIHFFISKEPYLLDKGIQPNEIPKLKNPRVSFHYVENIGLLRKIIPILKMYWSKPDVTIIIFDDDRKPQKDTVFNLTTNMGKSALTIGGYNIKPYTPVVGWLLKEKRVLVDASATCVGLSVKPNFFKREDIDNWIKFNDNKIDVRISCEVFCTFLFKKNGIPLYCVKGKCPTQYPDGGKSITDGEIYNIVNPSKLAQIEKWKNILMIKSK